MCFHRTEVTRARLLAILLVATGLCSCGPRDAVDRAAAEALDVGLRERVEALAGASYRETYTDEWVAACQALPPAAVPIVVEEMEKLPGGGIPLAMLLEIPGPSAEAALARVFNEGRYGSTEEVWFLEGIAARRLKGVAARLVEKERSAIGEYFKRDAYLTVLAAVNGDVAKERLREILRDRAEDAYTDRALETLSAMGDDIDDTSDIDYRRIEPVVAFRPRLLAIHGLVTLNARDALEDLLAIAGDESERAETRQWAVWALAHLTDPTSSSTHDPGPPPAPSYWPGRAPLAGTARDSLIATTCDDPMRVAPGGEKRGYFVTTVEGWPSDVYVSVPAADAPADGWPVLIMLFGAGSTGARICSLMWAWTLAHDVPAIVVAPNAAGGYVHEGRSAVDAVLTAASERWPVRSDSLLLFAGSLGAHHAWKLLAAGGETTSGSLRAAYLYGASPSEKLVDKMTRAKTRIPLFIHAAEKDRASRKGMRAASERLRSAGWDVVWRMEPDWEHSPDYKAYRRVFLDVLLPWLLAR